MSDPSPLAFPKLEGPHVRQFVVCGSISAPDGGEIPEVLSDENGRNPVAVYGDPAATVELWHRSLSDNHVHIQIYHSDFPGDIPDPTMDINAFGQRLTPLIGLNINALGTLRLEVPLNELPSPGLIRTAIETMRLTLGDLTFQQTGATFSVAGSAMSELEWSYNKRRNCVRIEISVNQSVTISSDYLLSFYAEATSAFRRWVLGEINE